MRSDMGYADINRSIDLMEIKAVWQSIRHLLEDEKRRIVQEIRHYPPPIPACDVQFNSLLAERATILQELGQVEEVLKSSGTNADPISLLDEFLSASHFITGDVEQNIRQTLLKLSGSDRQVANASG